MALFGEAVGNKGRQEIRGSEVGVEMMQLAGERLEIVGGECDVAALQGSAIGEIGQVGSPAGAS